MKNARHRAQRGLRTLRAASVRVALLLLCGVLLLLLCVC